MVHYITVKFSAEELEARSVLEGTPPVLSFYKSNHKPKIQGKIPYSKLLCLKISEAVPSHSKFTVADTWVEAAHGKESNFVRCIHLKRSPVHYIVEDMKQGSELEFSVEIQCDECFKDEKVPAPVNSVHSSTTSPTPQAFVSSNLPTTSANASGFIAGWNMPFPAVSLATSNELTPVFTEICTSFNSIVQKYFHLCSAPSDRKNYFAKKKQNLKAALNKAFDKATEAFIDEEEEEEVIEPVRDNEVQNRDKGNEENQSIQPQSAVPKKVFSLFENTQTQVEKRKTQAEKRKAEQAEAIAKKRKEAEDAAKDKQTE
jgi:hypothetical protein